ncbi:Ig-like domain-containing protein [Tabrizicola sp.]|uniref:Ig-like domain-containing protein n=1 Tax=Tabrizicola sp. TaxID=2005166 RepID=UPI002FDE9FCF
MPRTISNAIRTCVIALRVYLTAALLVAIGFSIPTQALSQSATVSASPSSFSSVGQPITFTYTINPGSYNMLSISGTSQIKGVPITCPTLPAGGTMSSFTCSSTYTVDSLDDMSGTFADFAVFTGTRTGGNFNITSPTLAVPKSGGGPVVMDVSASPSPATPGSTVTVSATISSMGCNAGLMPPGSLIVAIGSDSRSLPLVADFPYSTGDTVSFTSNTLAAGTYALSAAYAGGAGCAAGSASGTLVVEPRPTVTVASLGQTGSALHFSITFSAPVTGFTLSDIIRTASTGTPGYSLAGSGASYTLTANGMTAPTTIGVSVAANVAGTAAGSQNLSSGSPVSATFTPPPNLTSVSPSTGASAGGDSVTLTGQYFSGATGVTFGGASATGVTVVNDSTITATTPAGASGPVSVIVTTPYGSNTANTLFAYRDAQTISFTDPADRTFIANDSVPLVATATSGLTVSFTSATPTVCSVTGATATVLTGGICTINANQAGDVAYNPAPQVSQSFTISPASQTISFTDPADISPFVPNQAVALTATATSGLAVSFSSATPAVCSVSGTTATVLTAGTCSINADQAGSISYSAAPQVSQSFDISPADQTISFTDPADTSFVANGAVPLSATATSGLAVSFSSSTPAVCSVSGSDAIMLATGTCTIAADQAGDISYNPAPQVSQSFVISQASQTITFTGPADTSYVPNGTVSLSATATSGLTVTFASDSPAICSVSGNTATILAAGTCSIAADQAGDANYSAAPQVVRTFAITPADQTITFTSAPPSPAVYGGQYAVSASGGGSSNPVTFSSTSLGVCTVSGSTVDFVGVGLCSLTAFQAGDANHNDGSADQSFAVDPQPQTITFAPLTIAQGYPGGPTYAVSATGGASGEPVVLSVDAGSGANCSLSGNTVTFLAAGTCRINANQAGTAVYAAADQASLDIPVANNTGPTADAGPDQTGISEGATVTLDGSGSSDPDAGQTLTFSWAQVSGPPVTLSSMTDAQPSFTAPALVNGNASETIVFELTVSDGVGGTDTDQVSIGIVDLTNPTLVISGLPDAARIGQPFTVTFTFSETVTGFDAVDVTVSNASLGGFAGSGTTYTATITPDGNGDVSVTVPAGVAADLAGNPNEAAGATAPFTASAEAAELAAKEAVARNRALIQSQPDLTRFLTGAGRGGLTFSAKGATASFDLETDPDKLLWLQFSGRWGTGDLAADQYLHGVLGAHLYRTDTFIFGAMLQGDHSKMTDGIGSVSATGWLVGPYIVARPQGGKLIFSASYLAGRTDLSISPLGTYVDNVTSDRQLMTLSVANEIQMGNTLLLPRLDIARVVEDRPAYIDGLGAPVPAGSLTLTEASAGLDFETSLVVSDGTSRLTGGLSAIYSLTDQDGASDNRTRGRVSLGWLRQYDDGLTVNFDASYDGIGASDIGSLGVDFRVSLAF